MPRLLVLASLLGPSLVYAGQHDHFDSVVATLTESGHLETSAEMRSKAEVVAAAPCGDACIHVEFDSVEDATKFTSPSSIREDFHVPFSNITNGVIWLQFETKFHSGWATDTSMDNMKFVRVRKDNIGNDDRAFDFQNRPDHVCDGPGCPSGMPTVRCYDCSPPDGRSNPLSHPDDVYDGQPGGETMDISRPYDASDHAAGPEKPFLYMVGVWIRETYMMDLSTGRLKVWMSDENTDTTLLIADVNNSSLGFDINPTSTWGINRIRFGTNFSSNPPDPDVYHWHRNCVVGQDLSQAERDLLLSNRPGGDSVPNVAPAAPTGLQIEPTP